MAIDHGVIIQDFTILGVICTIGVTILMRLTLSIKASVALMSVMSGKTIPPSETGLWQMDTLMA